MAFFTAQIIGNQPNNEQFIIGLNVDTGIGGESSSQVIADHIKTAFASAWPATIAALGTMASKYPAGLNWQKVMVYERPTTMPSHATEVAEAPFSPVLVGSGSGTVLPPETAVCISLLTGAPGRSRRGRFYMPAPISTTLTTTGSLTGGVRDLFAGWAAKLVGDVNDASAGTNVVVWSRKLGTTFNVVQVAVGDQFDIQSRRQNNTAESYTYEDVSLV